MITRVSKDLCISCGLCPSLSPDLYKMDDDDKAIAIKESLTDQEAVEAFETAENCPVDAIIVE